MFVGIRDIINAKGRFGLIATVVGLITLLIVMLTGLTAGLGKQNTSALEALSPQSVFFSDMSDPSFSTSRIEQADAETTPGIPLGATQTLLERADGSQESVGVLGLPKGTVLPDGTTLHDDAVASSSLGLAVGEDVTVGPATIAVGENTEDLYYSHSLVLWVPTDTWQATAHTDAVGTVMISDQASDDALTLKESFNALPAYSSEQGSLQMMQGFLYVISALVTVAFLTVWTIQRTRDLSILKAIGAPTRYLLKDALGQAAVILAAGVIVGTLLAVGFGALASGVVPFSLTLATTLVPALGIWVLGMIGAAFATRSISKIDPHYALGGVA
ncbi:ABC transporter permease [Corynebacterium lubricantis]|uniref:ABC transporter permease n=1 Tax=Corynebacterium lubricantis TaxID=541095 RepID=UPI00037E0E77|nr:ABC transporter permease [Corynebacterium lubricantis]